MSRPVLIDDTSSDIQYSGPWFVSRGSQDNIGNFGPPFQSTLHGVNTNASLSFTFSGTKVIVQGTSNVRRSGSIVDPSWECFIDGSSIGAKDPIFFPENNWVLCEADGLSNGRHTIRVDARVNSQTFWFDRIQYVPSSSVNTDQALVLMDDTDSQIQYGSGWSRLRDIVTMTSTRGSSVSITFTGTSLSWYGFIPGNDIPGAPASATYSIDGGTPVTFQLIGLASGALELYNQVFFQTGQLSAGRHTLEVVHQGNSGTTPLTLDYFIIQNSPGASSDPTPPTTTVGTNPGSGSGSSSSANSGSSSSTASSTASGSSTSFSSTLPTATDFGNGSPAPSSSTTSTDLPNSDNALGGGDAAEKSSVSVGAIAGGVVGGLAVLAVAALIVFLCLRRRRRRKRESVDLIGAHTAEVAEPFMGRPTMAGSASIVEPFTGRPTTLGAYNPYAGSGSDPTTSPQSGSSPQGYGGAGKFAGGGYGAAGYGAAAGYNAAATGGYGPVSGQAPQPVRYQGSASSGPSVANYSTTDDSHANLIVSEKTREAAAEAASAAAAGSGSGSPGHSPQPSASSPAGPSAPRFVRHEDSGLRLPARESSNVVELPPLYTPG